MEAMLKDATSEIEDIANLLQNGSEPGQDDDHIQKRKQVATMLMMHLKNFHHVILMSRRRSQQRLRRRQKLLRSFYMKQMLHMQTSYLEMFSILGHKTLQQSLTKSTRTKSKSTRLPHSLGQLNEEQWLNNFRMRRRHFYWLCDQVRDSLKAADVNVAKHRIVRPETRVALALYMLAHGEYDADCLTKLFNVPITSVNKYLKQFASALLVRLGHKLLALPQQREHFDDIRQGFRELTSNAMPQAVVGVIGVCTMPVVNNNCSNIRLETLIDDRLLFRKLQISSKPTPALFSEVNNEITELNPQFINGRMVPSFVLAPVDQNFPLRPWLLQPYLDPTAPHEYDFNEATDALQCVSEKAFQRLFTRWQLLARPFQLNVDTSALVITACCALHNLLEELGEPYLQEWADAVDINGFMRGDCTPKPDACPSAEDALDIRDFLARTISSTEM